MAQIIPDRLPAGGSKGEQRSVAILQARLYQNGLRDECRKSPQARPLLLHASGAHEGQFVFPSCHFAVLSNITSEQLRGHRLGDLTPLFPPRRSCRGTACWSGRTFPADRYESGFGGSSTRSGISPG